MPPFQAMLSWMQQYREQFSKVQQLFSGKSREQQISELRRLYESKGMNLFAVAKQWGISL